ncbi:MAG: YqeG family HAD IIIA-type phosphatase [Fimbriimonadaceae bacterium]|nr:YqeG family HAD IIIA-type phosphatase [Fimbriimonadaceae bacterium]QYK56021.1 MAG: YqeG family HAD IIIA-type phosphatase [Fimbriimonadaceae bacterium]
MRHVRPGVFARQSMPSTLRRFSPKEALERLTDVDLDALKQADKRLILLDVDNTLIRWRETQASEDVLAWLQKAKALGFDLCILSNTNNWDRLGALSKAIDVPFIRDKNKPSRAMFQRALEKFGRKPEEAVMIGDQLFTDVLGANRSGIDAIWIRPMASHEFAGTRYISRNLERVAALFLYQYFQEHPPKEAVEKVEQGLYSGSTLVQFVRFIIVGASSTIIDIGLLFVVMFAVPINGQPLGTVLGEWLLAWQPGVFGFAQARPSDAAVPVLTVPVTSLAILNGFYWNRLWTFESRDPSTRHRQFVRYWIIALLAMLINAAVKTLGNNVLPGHAKLSLLAASAIATVVAGVFNFYFQRNWTFKS